MTRSDAVQTARGARALRVQGQAGRTAAPPCALSLPVASPGGAIAGSGPDLSGRTGQETTLSTYAALRGHPPDFIVRYRLYAPSEGGRKVTFQHLRCDFLYAGDDPARDGIYMIHPEFLDAAGEPLPKDRPVPLVGRASMWILVAEMRAFVHRARLRVGVRGHFMEGARRIGDVEVETIEGLHANPSQ